MPIPSLLSFRTAKFLIPFSSISSRAFSILVLDLTETNCEDISLNRRDQLAGQNPKDISYRKGGCNPAIDGYLHKCKPQSS